MANKYLDGAGLDHMWDKIKSYLTSNYATKSALSSGLAGKANSSHTHTSSQITDLNNVMGNMKLVGLSTITGGNSSTPVTLPSIAINEFKTFTTNTYAKFKLPSGGKYLIISNNIINTQINNSEEVSIAAIAAGGSFVFTDGEYIVSTTSRKGFYLRIS